ncbi:hypothetical protein Tco_1125173 [Tanacetum coccineum]|uniref:Uncharacterized protein n=1 Tax=Tanacetum coccineum TaxID=301880 RepID=A0ABQ5JB90_9ASTR
MEESTRIQSVGLEVLKEFDLLKWDQHSPSKKKNLVAVEEHAEKPGKKPATRRQTVGVQIRDTPGVSVSKRKTPVKTERSKGIELLFEAALLEEAQLKKAIKQSKQETNIHQARGLSDGAGLELEGPDEQKGKSSDTSEGTGLIPGVPDVSKADSSKRKGNEEMTDAEKVDAENENVNEEVAGDQVNDDAQATVTAALATQKTKVPLQSYSNSSDYANKFLNFDNIPSTDTKIILMMDIKVQYVDLSSQTSPLFTVHVLVIPESLTAPATTMPPPISPFISLPQQSTPIPTPTTTEAIILTTSTPDSSTLTAIYHRLFDLENY